MDASIESGYDSIRSIGELYDLASPYSQRTDVAFYIEEAVKSAGRVLEVACGTGRVLLPMARKGISITGIDQSPGMLERCHQMLDKEDESVRALVQLEQMDMRNFNLDDRFALATIPFRPMQHMITMADQLNTLRSVNRHLAPGGHLVFDVFNPDLARIAAGRTEEKEDTPERTLPDGRRARRTGRVTAVHKLEQINDVELIYYVIHPDGRTERLVQSFPMRWYMRYEVEHLLERCGFGLKALYGNFDRSVLTDSSPEMIFVAERR
ncbi:MAG: class I SAM-dependent methyltransferase [Gemmatimonadales bacterium]